MNAQHVMDSATVGTTAVKLSDLLAPLLGGPTTVNGVDIQLDASAGGELLYIGGSSVASNNCGRSDPCPPVGR
jgi:hypothetical protein